jgi:predicted enzyme related to lactoylglutathione lyase
MAKVIGVGGIFFKSKDGKKLGAWYRKNLGVDVQGWGGAAFSWEEKPASAHQRFTVWSPFAKDTKYFAPSREPYMINFIVDDLDALLKKLRKARVKIDKKGVEASEYGRFAWVMDPEGRKLELWEPPLKTKP